MPVTWNHCCFLSKVVPLIFPQGSLPFKHLFDKADLMAAGIISNLYISSINLPYLEELHFAPKYPYLVITLPY
jgi:hypothetical protein